MQTAYACVHAVKGVTTDATEHIYPPLGWAFLSVRLYSSVLLFLYWRS